MEGFIPVLFIIIAAIVSSALRGNQAGKAQQANRQHYAGLAEQLRRQMEQLSARQDPSDPQMPAAGYSPAAPRQEPPPRAFANQTTQYGAEGAAGGEGVGSEGSGAEGSSESFGRLRSARAEYVAPQSRLYSAEKVNEPPATENEPFFAGGQGAQVYSYGSEISAHRRPSASRRAVAIGSALSSAEGMAQAVVMAEVLMHRGGRGGVPWKN